MPRSRRPAAPLTPAVTVTVSGPLRFWVAEALLEKIRWAEDAIRARGTRRPIPPHRLEIVRELRSLYDEIVP